MPSAARQNLGSCATATSNFVPKTGGVIDAWTRSKSLAAPVRIVAADAAQSDLTLVQPCMVFFLRTCSTTGHTGLVVSNMNGLLETIEGNTNDGGSREGIGVFRRSRRRIEQISLGFAIYG